MILPIHIYGKESLRKECREVLENEEGLSALIDNMFETMYSADGIGLAAPQIGRDMQLFVIDITDVMDEESTEPEPFKRVFINAEIVDSSEELAPYTEGCLSLPGINENVLRPDWIELNYFDENFEEHTTRFEGMWARVIQHEYDHTIGKVCTDRVATLRRQLLRSKLQNLSRGNYSARYRTY